MNKKIIDSSEDSISYVKVVLPIIIILILIGALAYNQFGVNSENKKTSSSNSKNKPENEGGLLESMISHPLQITEMRNGEYPGSEITIEQTLPSGSNYDRYIASYKSEGLKIYALLTVPQGDKPQTGWPVVIFNHGYIPPAEYRTTERYIAYTDAFSRNGYIVFKSDYRGHGNSEGNPGSGGYGSTGYTVDVLNAVASVKKLKDPATGTGLIADANRMGMWGHSMGGYVTLRSMVISKDMKAGVIWAGVVASYPDLINRWRRNTITPAPTASTSRGWRQGLINEFGSPEENPEFWNSISANSYLADISGPIQLHHGTADHSVPVEFSETLDKQLKLAKKESELYIYEGDDHNIAANLGVALDRSVAFFDKYVKGIQQE